MKKIIALYICIAIAAVLNANMDYFGFVLKDYGIEWHIHKILMQFYYVIPIWIAFKISKGTKYWLYARFNEKTLFLIHCVLFAIITLVFHEIFYHNILK